MKYSHEKIYHFTCDKCELWWSVAAENMNMSKRSWICTWCGHKHDVPHKDLTPLTNLNVE